MPLPREIHMDQYEKRFAALSSEEKELAQKWYVLDLNTGIYRLAHFKTLKDPEYWELAHPALLKAFDGVEFSPSFFVGGSITQWEVQYALSDPERALWSHRIFTNPEMAYPKYPEDRGLELRDAQDNSKTQTGVVELLEKM